MRPDWLDPRKHYVGGNWWLYAFDMPPKVMHIPSLLPDNARTFRREEPPEIPTFGEIYSSLQTYLEEQWLSYLHQQEELRVRLYLLGLRGE